MILFFIVCVCWYVLAMLSSLVKRCKKRRKQNNSNLLLINRDVGDALSTKSEILTEWNDIIAERGPYDGAGFDWSPAPDTEGQAGLIDLVETGQIRSDGIEPLESGLFGDVGSDLFHEVESEVLNLIDDVSDGVLTEEPPLHSVVGRGADMPQYSVDSANRLSEASLRDLDLDSLDGDGEKRKEHTLQTIDQIRDEEGTLPEVGKVKESKGEAAAKKKKKKKKKASSVEYDFSSGLSNQASKKKKKSSSRKPSTEQYAFGGESEETRQPKQERKLDSVVASTGGKKPVAAQYSFVTSIDDVEDSDAPPDGDHTDKFTFI